MVKIEQTGGRLTEEEILHGKEDAYGIYQVNRKGAGRDYLCIKCWRIWDLTKEEY